MTIASAAPVDFDAWASFLSFFPPPALWQAVSQPDRRRTIGGLAFSVVLRHGEGNFSGDLIAVARERRDAAIDDDERQRLQAIDGVLCAHMGALADLGRKTRDLIVLVELLGNVGDIVQMRGRA